MKRCVLTSMRARVGCMEGAALKQVDGVLKSMQKMCECTATPVKPTNVGLGSPGIKVERPIY